MYRFSWQILITQRQDDKGNLYFKKASSHAISRALQVGIAYDCLKAREEARDENVVLKQGKDFISVNLYKGFILDGFILGFILEHYFITI